MFRFKSSLLSLGVVLTALAVMTGCGTETPVDTRTPVEKYGMLQINADGKLSDANGNPVQLKGMSLFYSNWGGAWFNESAVDQAVDYLGCEIIRAPLGVMKIDDVTKQPAIAEAGYLDNSQQAANKARVTRVVDEAIYKGIYVIIDWHDHVAESHTQLATDFFVEMAGRYGNTPNVLFEIYNEPFTQDWNVIKTYANTVISAIRGTGAKNVIIVGTPFFSQQVDKAAADRLADENTAYALHFYAGEHPLVNWKANLESALANRIAVVASEWGTCLASGQGSVNTTNSDEWVNWMQANQISWTNWELFDKPAPEAASMFINGTSFVGPWAEKDLTADGVYVKSKLPAPVTQMFATPSLLVFPPNGGTLSTTLHDNSMTGWQVKSAPSWVTVSPTSGSYLGGSGIVNISTTGPNEDPTNERKGFVELYDGAGNSCHVTVIQQPATSNLALNKTTDCSSEESASYLCRYAVDGDTTLRWASQFSDPQWICVDLGSPYYVTEVKLDWEAAYSSKYRIELSSDSTIDDCTTGTWTEIYRADSVPTGLGNHWDDITSTMMTNTAVSGRFIKMYSESRATVYGNSLLEFEVYGHP